MRINSSITLSIFIVFFFCFQAGIYPQNRTVFPRIEADEKALEYYNLGTSSGTDTEVIDRGSPLAASRGTSSGTDTEIIDRGSPLAASRGRQEYSWTQLAQISLWASGNTAPANMEKIGTIASNLLNSPDLPSAGKERAEFILNYMHRNILRTYSIYQTKVDTILSHGSYNCVSSSALYIILCEAAGIKTSGVVTRQHAFVIVHIDGENYDVETTNRYGFDPGNRKEFHDQFGRLTGFSYVPAQNYRDRQTISKIELISLIMNNRIADLERTNRYADAVPIAVDRAALLFGNSLAATERSSYNEALFTDPREDLMNRLFNYGAFLLKANKEEESIQWALLVSSKYLEPVRWQEIISVSVNNRIARNISARRPSEARLFLDKYKSHLTEDDYQRLDIIVIDADIYSRANLVRTAEEGDAILNAIIEERNNGKIDERRADELIIFTVQKIAAGLSAAPARNWRAAIQYIAFAISIHGKHSELELALRTYRNNLASDYHNQFASEWNKRNYGEAQRILNEGLAEFPDNRQLLQDKEIVNRQRARQ